MRGGSEERTEKRYEVLNVTLLNFIVSKGIFKRRRNGETRRDPTHTHQAREQGNIFLNMASAFACCFTFFGLALCVPFTEAIITYPYDAKYPISMALKILFRLKSRGLAKLKVSLKKNRKMTFENCALCH